MRRRVPHWTCIVVALMLGAARAGAVPQWEPIGPPGGRALTLPGEQTLPGQAAPPVSGGSWIGAVAVDPADGRKVYAATSDGFFVSSDGGASWTFANATAQSAAELGIGKIVLDPLTPTTLYVASCCGILKSTDGGATFAKTALEGTFVDFAIDATVPSTLYAIMGAGLYRTSDAGATWTLIAGLPAGAASIASGGPSSLYVAADGGVFESEDGAQTWTPTALTSKAFYVTTPPGDGTTVWAWTSDGLQKSANGGTSWDPIALPTTAGVGLLAFDPGDPSLVYAALSPPGVLRTPDGGMSWFDVSDGFVAAYPLTAIAVDAHDPATVYVGTRGRAIAKTVDAGAAWTPLGIDVSRVSMLAVHPAAPGTVFVQNEIGLFRTTNGGTTWTQADTPAGYFGRAAFLDVAFDPGDPTVAYAGTTVDPVQSSSVHASADGGLTWGPTSPTPGGSAANVLAFDPRESTLYAGVAMGPAFGVPWGGEVFRSPDGGLTWPWATTLPPHGLMRAPLSLVVDPVHVGRLHAGTFAGVWTSADRGDTWTVAAAGLEDRSVRALAIDPSSTLFAGTRRVVASGGTSQSFFEAEGTGVFKKSEGGGWMPASDGLWPLDGSLGVNDLAVDPDQPATLYAATDAGVSSTRNGAGHWEPTSLRVKTSAIAVDRTEPRVLYAGTTDRGLFRTELAVCAGVADCDDGDPCTTDVCDPANELADLGGCVRDRTGFAGVACLLRRLRDALPCADVLNDRVSRGTVKRLTRASRLVDKAASRGRRARLRRAAALIRRSTKRIHKALIDGGPGSSACLMDLEATLEVYGGQIGALRSR